MPQQPTIIDNNSRIIKQVIIIIAVVVVIAIVIKVYKATKTVGSIIGDKIGSEIIAQQTGITPARQLALKKYAQDAFYAIWGDANLFGTWWSRKFNEDEQTFITQLNKLNTPNEVALFCDLYREISGVTAAKDYMEALSTSEKQQVKPSVSNILS